MESDSENLAAHFLELASEQRIEILKILSEENLSISQLAKRLDATPPEVHRNTGRLYKTGLIEKNTDSTYSLSLIGNGMLKLFPSFEFLKKNRSYLEKHSFGDLEDKFIERIGDLQNHKKIKGFVKVIEKWKQIHENANKYIFNILGEVPYSKDIIDVVEKKLKSEIEIRSVFFKDAVIPEDRKELFEKKNFQKYIEKKLLQRKMVDRLPIIVLINEMEGGVLFLNKGNELDMSEMLYSDDSRFHSWCLDYFNDCWQKSGTFREQKLKS